MMGKRANYDTGGVLGKLESVIVALFLTAKLDGKRIESVRYSLSV